MKVQSTKKEKKKNIRTVDGIHIQREMILHSEVDITQGGEDVDDWKIYLLEKVVK